MLGGIVDEVKATAISRETFGSVKLLYQKSAATEMRIERAAMQKLLMDMNREYENAGVLVGGVDSAGKAIFDEYITVKRQIRGPEMMYIYPAVYKKQIDKLHSKGFNAILHLHLHPDLFYPKGTIAQAYSMLEQQMNPSDKESNMKYYSMSKRGGFSLSMAGVVTLNLSQEGGNSAYLNIFDTEQGARRVEGYLLSGESKEQNLFKAMFGALRKELQKEVMNMQNSFSMKQMAKVAQIPSDRVEEALIETQEWYNKLPSAHQKRIWFGKRKGEEGQQLVFVARLRNRVEGEEISAFASHLRDGYRRRQ